MPQQPQTQYFPPSGSVPYFAKSQAHQSGFCFVPQFMRMVSLGWGIGPKLTGTTCSIETGSFATSLTTCHAASRSVLPRIRITPPAPPRGGNLFELTDSVIFLNESCSPKRISSPFGPSVHIGCILAAFESGLSTVASVSKTILPCEFLNWASHCPLAGFCEIRTT